MERKFLRNVNQVKVYKSGVCIEAQGKNADAIADAAAIALLLIGVAVVIQAVK